MRLKLLASLLLVCGAASAQTTTPVRAAAAQAAQRKASVDAGYAPLSVVYAVDYQSAGPDVSYWIKAALTDAAKCPRDAKGYNHCTVILPGSEGGIWSQTVLVTSPFVSIYGQGKSQSMFACTVGAGHDCLRVYTLPFDPSQQAGTFQGFSLTGGFGNGIHIGDIEGLTLRDIGLNYFYQTGGVGLWLDNANIGNLRSGTYTEDLLAEGLSLECNGTDIKFTNEVQPGNTYGGNPSFAYTRILDAKLCSLSNGGGVGISLNNSAQVYNSTLRITENANGATSILSLSGTSQFQGELHLAGEGTSTNLLKGSPGTLLTLTQDSSVQWLGSSAPPSTLASGSGMILGPVGGIASGTLASLIPSLSFTSQNPIRSPGLTDTALKTAGYVTNTAGGILGTATMKAPQVTVETNGKPGIYTTPAGTLYLEVEMCGPGGGGAGSGRSPGKGGSGLGATVFGLLSAGAGGGSTSYLGGAGGRASGGDLNLAGAEGGAGEGEAQSSRGGMGGSSYFGGAGTGSATLGTAASTNSCSGGGGGSAAGYASGGGGGAGAYLRKTISSPSSTYTYTVGAGGPGGAAGKNGSAGGVGAAGIVIVKAYFQ
jgi:hypothetical protein